MKISMNYQEFYSKLFKGLEEKYGSLDEDTLTSIVGFSGGGPVSLSTIENKKLYVTCELAVYPEQQKSSEKINYELMSVGDFTADWCRSVFTALGNLSMNAKLGSGHRIDISGLVEESDPIKEIKLKLFSKIEYEDKYYGVYQVLPS
jgi:hypothetical protein